MKTLSLSAAAACLLAVGCHANTTRVSGKIVRDGQPYALETGERFSVVFYKAGEGKGKPPLAIDSLVRADGTFEPAYGADGNRLPPGTYKIGLSSGVYEPGMNEPKKRKFADEFADYNTPLTFTAEAGQTVVLTIDVAKRQLTQ